MRMKFLTRLATSILIVVLTVSTSAQAQETITWGVFHRPPSIDITDINHPSGYSGELLQLLQDNMPGYQFKYQEMNMPRILQELEAQENMCNNFLFKNPKREKFALFSLPLRINLPLRIVMKKSTFQRLGNPISLSFKELLRSTQLRGILEKGRSYSALDSIIKDNPSNNLIQEVITSRQLLEMLKLDRMDYFIEYSMVSDQLIEHTGQFVFVSIEELEPYAYSYAACPSNEWGQKTIAEINKALRAIVETEEFKILVKSLYLQESDRNYVDKVYENEFLNEYKK